MLEIQLQLEQGWELKKSTILCGVFASWPYFHSSGWVFLWVLAKVKTLLKSIHTNLIDRLISVVFDSFGFGHFRFGWVKFESLLGASASSHSVVVKIQSVFGFAPWLALPPHLRGASTLLPGPTLVHTQFLPPLWSNSMDLPMVLIHLLQLVHQAHHLQLSILPQVSHKMNY